MLLNDCVENGNNAKNGNAVNIKSCPAVIPPPILLQRICRIKILPVREGGDQRSNHGGNNKQVAEVADEIMHSD